MNTEIVSSINNLNAITILGYSGHGKKYFSKELSKIIDKEVAEISFTKRLEEIIANSINEDMINNIKAQNKSINTDNADKYKLLQYLKSNYPEIKLFSSLNATDLIEFLTGSSFILKIDRNFKIKLACLDGIESIKKKKDVMFLSTTAKLENELFFMLGLNKTNDPFSFFSDYIASNTSENFSKRNIDTNFEIRMNFQLEKYETDFLHNIYVEIEKLNEIFKSFLENPNSNFKHIIEKSKNDYKNTQDDFKKITEFGVFHIFRPLLPRNKEIIESIKKKPNKEILEYTNISRKEFFLIQEIYRCYDIDFTITNISNFGFLKTDPKNLSEQALNNYKPIGILNTHNINISDITKQIEKIENT